MEALDELANIAWNTFQWLRRRSFGTRVCLTKQSVTCIERIDLSHFPAPIAFIYSTALAKTRYALIKCMNELSFIKKKVCITYSGKAVIYSASSQ